MKRFNELTKNEQESALAFAEAEVKELIEEGFVFTGKIATNEIVREYALIAAEEAWYSERDDKVIDDIVEPL